LSGWDHTMEGGLGLGDANPPAYPPIPSTPVLLPGPVPGSYLIDATGLPAQSPATSTGFAMIATSPYADAIAAAAAHPDYPTGFPGHPAGTPWTPVQITALGTNEHYDLVTGVLTNAFPVDPTSMGMAWDNDSQAYQVLSFFNKYALPAPPAVAALPMCGPSLAAGVMCDPGYGDVAIPNPPYPGGSVRGAGPGPAGPNPLTYGTLPPEVGGVQVPLVTQPVLTEQTPFDQGNGVPVPSDVTLPTDVYAIPLNAGNTLAMANGGNVSPAPISPLAPAQVAAPSSGLETPLLLGAAALAVFFVMRKR
jgi:hypothetical protein